jgi:membrane-bound metal-dependent hydrolase YbcI (DUF457 family)
LLAWLLEKWLGRDTTQSIYAIAVAYFCVFVFCTFRRGSSAIEMAAAVFVALAAAAIAGIVRTFTVPPLSQAVQVERSPER